MKSLLINKKQVFQQWNLQICKERLNDQKTLIKLRFRKNLPRLKKELIQKRNFKKNRRNLLEVL